MWLFELLKKYPAIRFLFTGGLNTILCLSLYYLLLKLKVHYLIASVIMYIFGILNGFMLSSFFVFEKKTKLSGLIKYAFIYLLSLGCNLFLMYFMVNVLVLHKFLAQVLTTAFLTVFNYQLIKRFVFFGNR